MLNTVLFPGRITAGTVLSIVTVAICPSVVIIVTVFA